MKRSQRHAHYLEELVRNLALVGEDVRNVGWIMHEGIWYRENSKMCHSMCDLVIGYYDFSVNLVELKGSTGKRAKALRQLNSGVSFVEQHLPSYKINELKFVVYTHGQYGVERYDRNGQRIE